MTTTRREEALTIWAPNSNLRQRLLPAKPPIQLLAGSSSTLSLLVLFEPVVVSSSWRGNNYIMPRAMVVRESLGSSSVRVARVRLFAYLFCWLIASMQKYGRSRVSPPPEQYFLYLSLLSCLLLHPSPTSSFSSSSSSTHSGPETNH